MRNPEIKLAFDVHHENNSLALDYYKDQAQNSAVKDLGIKIKPIDKMLFKYTHFTIVKQRKGVMKTSWQQ